MNPKLTPEIESALKEVPFGPIRLEGSPGSEPVYVVRLDDITGLQQLVDSRVRKKLLEADSEIAAGRIEIWDAEAIKQSGRSRVENHCQ